ncbi:hypothetical protein BX666DRAFT_47398 [Dichotomocladium elegans]|nr:hypothetical protein BX666DRAFT_47398 [Dichotomocladium elegans]
MNACGRGEGTTYSVMPRFRSLSTSTTSTPPSSATGAATAAPATRTTSESAPTTRGSSVAVSGTTSPNTFLSRGFRSLRRVRRRSVSVPSSSDQVVLQERQNVFPLSSSSSSSSIPRSPLANQIDPADDLGNQQQTQDPTTSVQTDVDTDQQQQMPASAGAPSADKKHIRLVPNVGIGNRCFVFDVIERDLRPGEVFKIGRYSDRNAAADRLSFKSKVVSRSHAELWAQDGKVYLRDIGSSSGTFVNRARLSPAGQWSAPQEIRDGDIVQFGVDYQGGLEPAYRAVRTRIEIDRAMPKPSQSFGRQAFQQLRQHYLATTHPALINTAMDNNSTSTSTSAEQSPNSQTSAIRNLLTASDIQECCICLYAIAPLQALFITPCSHTFHFKCLRPILFENYPGFSCPICRAYADLEASVAVEVSDVLEALNVTYEDEERNIGEGKAGEPGTTAGADLGHPLQQTETLHDNDNDQNLPEVDIVPPLIEEEEESQQSASVRGNRLPEDEEAQGNPDPSTASGHHQSRITDGLLSSTLVATPPTFEHIFSSASNSPR